MASPIFFPGLACCLLPIAYFREFSKRGSSHSNEREHVFTITTTTTVTLFSAPVCRRASLLTVCVPIFFCPRYEKLRGKRLAFPLVSV